MFVDFLESTTICFLIGYHLLLDDYLAMLDEWVTWVILYIYYIFKYIYIYHLFTQIYIERERDRDRYIHVKR